MFHPIRQFMHFQYAESRPRIENWKPIELADDHLDFTNAIEIAEENGGKNYRRLLNDDCSLHIRFFPGHSAQSGYWRVIYSSENHEAEQEIWFRGNKISSIQKKGYPKKSIGH